MLKIGWSAQTICDPTGHNIANLAMLPQAGVPRPTSFRKPSATRGSRARNHSVEADGVSRVAILILRCRRPAAARPADGFDRVLLSSIERRWTADEPIAPNVEAQRTVGRARNADPFTLPDFARRLIVITEP